MTYALCAIATSLVAFIWWRYSSVGRGARQRDEKLLKPLDPIAQKLTAKEQVEPNEVAALARQPQYRPMLYAMLAHFERLDLFPQGYVSTVAQGEGLLAYWLMHPNELQNAPSEIEFVKNEIPYAGLAGGCSRCSDKDGVAKPSELVDWYLDMMVRKGVRLPAGAGNS